jgi:tol-pal system protein YbgF
MRRIKTYVMTVGVALSVAPIFNYALAQQGNSATQLLLQVQDMRQEVGQLRDLIERQQFQLTRLQQQSDAQKKQLELFQSARLPLPYDGALNTNLDPSSYNNALGQAQSQPTIQSQPVIQSEPQTIVTQPQQAVSSYTSTSSEQAVSAAAQVSQRTKWDATEPQGNEDFYLPNTPSQATPQNTISAANENAYTAASARQPSEQGAAIGQQNNSIESVNSVYPPIVDRSFSTSAAEVPVTGAGSQQVSSTNQQVNNSQFGGQAQAANSQVQATNNQVQATNNQAQAANNQAQTANNQAQAAMQYQTVNSQGSSASVALATEYAASSVGQNQGLQNTRPQIGQVPQFSNNAAIVSAPSQVVSAPSQVVSVPSQVVSVPSQVVSVSSAVVTGQTQNSIDASQMPNQVASAVPMTLQPALSQPQVQAVLSEEEYYAQGFELLKQSKYEEAASIFEQQLNAHPRGDLADDAHYWIAEAMHVSRKLDIAKIHLKAIISDYPQSRRLPDAMLKTAYIEQSQGNQIEARILFQEIVNLHPQSDAAIAAKNQLAAVN